MKDMMMAFGTDKTAGEIVTSGGNFKANLEQYSNSVSNDYMRRGTDMNESIAKIASRNGLNDDQIQRVVEESNNKVYLAKYAGMKHLNEREVTFDRADAEKVKLAKQGNTSDLTKIASAADEPLTAFNSTRNLTGAMTPAAPTDLVKLAMDKLAADLDSAAKEYDKASVEFDAQIYKVAGMMLKYDRAGIDTNEAFAEICRKNNFHIPVQKIIKEAADHIISEEVAAGKLDPCYKLNLDYIDMSIRQNDYSLGHFSKIASMNFEDRQERPFPVIQLNGTLIKSVGDMVKYASAVNTLFTKVGAAKEVYEKMQEKTNFRKVGE